jgi:hypothetical protein
MRRFAFDPTKEENLLQLSHTVSFSLFPPPSLSFSLLLIHSLSHFLLDFSSVFLVCILNGMHDTIRFRSPDIQISSPTQRFMSPDIEP